MQIRSATIDDIPQIQLVRNAVKENMLSNPALVTNADCEKYLTLRGKGWVCEIEQQVVGFAIADLEDNNIWALFLLPAHEGRGIGRQLHDTMMNWYFEQGKETVWLSTSPGTRAEKFYRHAGWQENGTYGKGEVKFEMTRQQWISRAL